VSTDREVTRIVRSWLEEGVTALPDRVLDTVLDRAPATRQRPAWWPARRLPQMNSPIRIAAAVAAVLVVAVAGVYFLPRAGGLSIGAPPATPSPTPTPTPAPSLPASGEVPPGSYRFDFITFTLPAGWNATQDGAFKPDAKPPNGMAINTWRSINTVYTDPCHWQTTAVSVNPTVDAVVAALVAQKQSSKVTPTDVTVDGFRGKEIDLMVPLDVVIANCDGAQYTEFTEAPPGGDRYNQGPGQHDLLDILDVNGQVLTIKRSYWPANTPADLAELKAIFDSIRITP
jgi:hypothetical protein